MTTETTARQPKGIPVGGQFAATSHAEPSVDLAGQQQKSVTEHFLDREAVQNRRRRLQEQLDRVDKIQTAHSLRSVAALIQARYPGATTLRIAEDRDGHDKYEPISIADEDGALIQIVLEDDDWVYEEMVQDGPNIRELVEDLSNSDDSWTEGIGNIHGTRKHQTKMVDINLAAARNAPDPFIAEEHDPRTQSLSEDEQTDLVEAANHGVVAMEDILDDNNSFDEYRQHEVMSNLKNRVNTLLTVTKQAD